MSNYTNNVESVSFVCFSLQWCQCWWCRDRARHSTKFWRSSDGSAAAGTLDSNTGRQLQQPRHRVQVYLDHRKLVWRTASPPTLQSCYFNPLSPGLNEIFWATFGVIFIVSLSLCIVWIKLFMICCSSNHSTYRIACSYLQRNKLHFYKDIKIITMSPFFCWVTIKRLERKRKNV